MTRRLFAVAVGIAIAMFATTPQAKSHNVKYYANAHHYQHFKKHRHWHRGSVRKKRSTARHVRSRASKNRNCLVPTARALLARIEAQFGPVQVISTCRPGAVIAGSGRPSLHRDGRAIDFRTPHKAAVVRWLTQNHRGGTMTYRHSNHIHVDVGRHFVALGSGGSRRGRSTRQAYRSESTGRYAASRNDWGATRVSSGPQYLFGNWAYAYAASYHRPAAGRRARQSRVAHGT